jgi:putative iron-regulated protein
LSYKNAPVFGIFIAAVLQSAAINGAYAASAAATAESAEGAENAIQHNQKSFSYRIAGADRHAYNYDAKAQILGYAQLAFGAYSLALADGEHLKAAIDALLASPGDDSLTRARDAWLQARRSWEETEAFRFYDGPIDVADSGPGPLARIDGWPVDPQIIDYVDDNPTSGIVNNMKLALTRATLLGRQSQPGPQKAVTTGWHAIEFLLWGQESATLGEPGDRPPTDYLPGQPNNDRRRAYLKLTSDLLIEDLRYLVESWDPKSRNYAAAFRVLNQREAVGRIMNGVALLAGQELAITRLANALDSRDRTLLTSRFSGASYQDCVFALRAVRNVWTGDQGGETRPGLELLVQRTDPAISVKIGHALDQAEESVAMLHTPLDRETLPAPPGAPARQAAERAIADLKRLASLIRDAGLKLGVAVTLPN